MNCDRFEKELEKLGNWQTLRADDAFTRHRRECPTCENKFAEYAELCEVLKSDTPTMPDESYWASFPTLVHERIESRKARPVWKPVLAWGSGLAALLLVVGIVFFRPGQKADLSNMTAGEAFKYLSTSSEVNDTINLSENSFTSFAAQAEEEVIGKNEVYELVYTLSEDELQKLEERLKSFKL